MVNYDDYMDDDFVDYEMVLHKINGNVFTFRVKLYSRIVYGESFKVAEFLINECIFYLQHKYNSYKGRYIAINIDRMYNGSYRNFVDHATYL